MNYDRSYESRRRRSAPATQNFECKQRQSEPVTEGEIQREVFTFDLVPFQRSSLGVKVMHVSTASISQMVTIRENITSAIKRKVIHELRLAYLHFTRLKVVYCRRILQQSPVFIWHLQLIGTLKANVTCKFSSTCTAPP